MAELVKLAPGALAVGQALPWSVYDDDGGLLVRKGYVVTSERQLERLYERGRFYSIRRPIEVPLVAEPEPAQEKVNPFAEYPQLLRDLEAMVAAIVSRTDQASRLVQRLVERLDLLCTRAPDACLALVHNRGRAPTAFEQTLFHGILCRITAARLGWQTARAMELVSAALTANLALIRHQDKLNSSRNGLTEGQRQIIRKHPLLSAEAVSQAGLEGPRLLQIIEQHHEQADGSGYPGALKGAAILPEARVLALAERYTAMICPRGYRKRFRADQAMAEILAGASRDPDPGLAHALARELTAYPPGVTVRLGGGETAVVTHRPIAGEAPVAQAIISPKGNPYIGSFFRDCDEHRIEGIVVPERLPALNMSALWGYV